MCLGAFHHSMMSVKNLTTPLKSESVRSEPGLKETEGLDETRVEHHPVNSYERGEKEQNACRRGEQLRASRRHPEDVGSECEQRRRQKNKRLVEVLVQRVLCRLYCDVKMKPEVSSDITNHLLESIWTKVRLDIMAETLKSCSKNIYKEMCKMVRPTRSAVLGQWTVVLKLKCVASSLTVMSSCSGSWWKMVQSKYPALS